jgi:hypothetical protein
LGIKTVSLVEFGVASGAGLMNIVETAHPDWREEFIDWLRQWGDLPEASRQARIAFTLHLGHPGLERVSQSAPDALARGGAPSGRPD